MLNYLCEYAKRKQLIPPTGYANKTVAAYISLSTQSEYIGIELGDGIELPCPDIGYAANGKDKSNVIAEKRFVVLSDSSTPKGAFFLNTLRDAAAAEPMLNVCVQTLEDDARKDKINELLDRNHIKASDRISFRVDGENVLKSSALAAWWKDYRLQFQKKESGNLERCLITGELTVPLVTTPAIQGLGSCGGHPRGDGLICFDKDAFTSYGLKQAANAPVSEEAFGAVKAALDSLLKSAPTVAGMKFVHWYDADIQPEQDPIVLYSDLFRVPDENEDADKRDASDDEETKETAAVANADRLVRSVYGGAADIDPGNTVYHIMMLSGVGGRVMIRSYEQGAYSDLKENLSRWQKDLSLVHFSGNRNIAPVKLSARLIRLLKYQKTDKKVFERLDKELKGITQAILRSILNGTPLPDSVAVKALAYIRSRIFTLNDEPNSIPDVFEDIGMACQWLKVWLIRNRQKGNEIMNTFNPENKNTANLCGAMLAVYEKIQQIAYPRVNANIVQRYYASAIQTPSLVLGRLSQMSVHHLEKIKTERKYLADYYSGILGELASGITEPIPTVLSLEMQTEFSVGYYQMSAELRKKRTKENTDKTEE